MDFDSFLLLIEWCRGAFHHGREDQWTTFFPVIWAWPRASPAQLGSEFVGSCGNTFFLPSLGIVWAMIGLDDLKNHFHPKWFHVNTILVCNFHNVISLQFSKVSMDYLGMLGCERSNLLSFGSRGRKQLHFCSFQFNTDSILDRTWCIDCQTFWSWGCLAEHLVMASYFLKFNYHTGNIKEVTNMYGCPDVHVITICCSLIILKKDSIYKM